MARSTPQWMLFVLFGLILSTSTARAGVYEAPIQRDAWLREAAAFENYGADEELKARRQDGDSKRPILEFDLAAIPAGSTVSEAILQLAVTSEDGSGLPLHVHRVTSSWAETGVKWNNAASAFDTTVVEASFHADDKGMVTVDLTDLVRRWVEGSVENHGILILPTSVGQESRFASREFAETDGRPHLRVRTAPTEVVRDRFDVEAYDNQDGSLLWSGPWTEAGDDGDPTKGDIRIESFGTVPRLGLTIREKDNAIWRSADLSGYRRGSLVLQCMRVDLRDANDALLVEVSDDGGLGWTELGRLTGPADDADLQEVVFPLDGHLSPSTTVRLRTINFGGGQKVLTDQMELRVEPAVDIAIAKVVDDSLVEVGQTVVFTVAAQNLTATAATGVRVLDLLPAGLTLLDAQPTLGTFESSTSTWSIASLGGEALAELRLEATVDAGEAGRQLENVATLIAVDQEELDPSNDTARAAVEVTNLDLALTKAVDDATVDPGQQITFTVGLANLSGIDATNVIVLDELPSGLTLTTHEASAGTFDPPSGKWSLGALAAGATATLTLNTRVSPSNASGTLNNRVELVEATPVDVNPANDAAEASVTVASADLGLTQFVDDPLPNEGDVVRFTVSLSNAGPEKATNVTVLDSLPDGLVLAGSSLSAGSYDPATGRWSVGDLAVGGNALLALQAQVEAETGGSSITNAARIVASDQADPVDGNDVTSVPITVQSADLELHKTIDDPSPTGASTVRYTLELTNHGPDVATNVAVGDTLPSEVTFLGTSATHGSYSVLTDRWDVGRLEVGETAVLLIDALVDLLVGGDTVSNRAWVTDVDQADPTPQDTASSAEFGAQSADLRVTMDALPLAPDIGDTVSFVVDLVDLGDDDATGVAVRFALPSLLVVVDHIAATGSYDPGTGTWSVGSLAALDSTRLMVRALVPPDAAGRTFSATATIEASDQADPDGTDNTAVSAVDVQLADLEVRTRFEPEAASEGDTVTAVVELLNHGPDPATAIVIGDSLHSGLQRISATATEGTFNPVAGGIGEWSLDTLATGATQELRLGAVVDGATAGTRLDHAAWVASLRTADAAATNDTAATELPVALVDLHVHAALDRNQADVGETITLQVSLHDHGPDDATEATVELTVPAGLAVSSWASSAGSLDAAAEPIFDGATPHWEVPYMAAGDSATLTVELLVGAGVGGSVLPIDLRVIEVHQTDVEFDNDTASVALTVMAADLSVSQNVDIAAPRVGDVVAWNVTLTNLGPDPAVGIVLEDELPVGVTLVSVTSSAGDWDDPTGTWSLDVLAAGADAALELSARVETGTAGTVLTNLARVVATDREDPVADNDQASSSVEVAVVQSVAVWAEIQSSTVLVPGGSRTDALRLHLRNDGTVTQTLTRLSVENRTTGPGSPADFDEEWGEMQLVYDGTERERDTNVLAVAGFVDGVATFETLSVALGPGSRRDLVVLGGASLRARDGDQLDLRVAGAQALVFSDAVEVEGDFPLEPTGSFGVDGMSAAQIRVDPVGSGTLFTGTERNLALSFTVPANGYELDRVTRLNVLDEGNSPDQEHLSRMELWVDDGDGTFDPELDPRVGTLVPTGSLWEVSGLAVDVPPPGRRLFVSVDVVEQVDPGDPPLEGRTVRLTLPSQGEMALLMQSSNDGPVDRAVSSPEPMTIATIDKISLTAGPIEARPLRPGEDGVLLSRLILENTYSQTETLHGITFSNATAGSGTQEELDRQIELLLLAIDENADAVYDPATDTALGTASFVAGLAAFEGLGLDLSPLQSQRLLLVGRVSEELAADGDILGARIAEAKDLRFSRAVGLAGSFPLDSGSAGPVDGMLASQLASLVTPVTTLGPGEGPALALDLVVPGNGYLDDTLEGLTLENRGTATASDLAEIRLWLDGGDGQFGAGAPSDDVDLGPLVSLGERWTSPLLGRVVPASGARVFVAVRASTTPSDSVTVQLAVPRDGVVVASGNDGPIDADVVATSTLLLSSAPLLASLEIDPRGSTLGQSVDVRMVVRNVSDETVLSVGPAALDPIGAGVFTPISGPFPPTFDLAQGAADTFAWTYRADGAGALQVSSHAGGMGEVSGLARFSLESASNEHRVFVEADSVALVPVPASPFTVSQGQANVVPLSLTFRNEGLDQGSDVLLRRLRLRLADDAGTGIIPADLLEAVAVSEGTLQYLRRSNLETAGDEIDLTLSTPVRISPQELATLNLQLDLRPDTQVPAFVVSIEAADWFAAQDATSGVPVSVALDSGVAGYPIRSGLALVRAEATQLVMSSLPLGGGRVVRGQTDVPVQSLELTNPGVTDLTADVRLGRMGFVVTDTTGGIVADPATYVQRLRLVGPGGTVAEVGFAIGADTTASLPLSPTVSVPAGTPIALELRADIAPGAPLDAFRLRARSAPHVDAWDANTAVPVQVQLASAPVEGPAFGVDRPAETVSVSGEARLEPTVVLGQVGVAALSISLRHPGPPGTAAVRVDTLGVSVGNDARQPLDAATYLAAITVERDGAPIATFASVPPGRSHLALALDGLVLTAQQQMELTLVVDVALGAPPGFLELRLRADDLVCADASSGAAVLATAEAGTEMPLSSGLTRVTTPPQELLVSWTDLMPTMIAPGQTDVELCRVGLANPVAAESGDILLEVLVLRGRDRGGEALALGRALRRVRAELGGEVMTISAELEADSTVARLRFTPPLVVPPTSPDQPIELSLRADLADPAGATSVAVGLEAAGVRVVQPESSLLEIRVAAPDGQGLPYWTRAGGMSALTLEESFANYPNPFAAGRESTHIPFYLPGDGRVTVDVYTLDGRRVVRLLEDSPYTAGLHDNLEWDGRNGNGEVVRNGVYLLRLHFAGQSSQELLRKVAVVR